MTAQATPTRNLQRAVHRNNAPSRAGLLERLFTFAFRGLVYPQIWEDPEVDLRALALAPQSRIAAIASGGCNVLSYLTADPREIIAVDLNRTHVALTRLKLAGVRYLPSHGAFYRFFGQADQEANLAAYGRFLQSRLDPETRAYWEQRDALGRRRITLFARGLYRHGLLGVFIGLAHRTARLYGADPRQMTKARTLGEQRAYFETKLAPLFDKRLVRWATSQKLSLFGLGIPPAQYEALAGGGDMAGVLRERLERLACGFPLSENYFAWQAFGRGYSPGPSGSLPPYLKVEHFDGVRGRADRVKVLNRSLTDQLRDELPLSFDAYVLLDAQDWMTDWQLNELWAEITRTARPGARVIFRTAAQASVLPGRVNEAILRQWDYRVENSRELSALDRSCIYGGFHLYVFSG